MQEVEFHAVADGVHGLRSAARERRDGAAGVQGCARSGVGDGALLCAVHTSQRKCRGATPPAVCTAG
jgi:hypothetical protein